MLGVKHLAHAPRNTGERKQANRFVVLFGPLWTATMGTKTSCTNSLNSKDFWLQSCTGDLTVRWSFIKFKLPAFCQRKLAQQASQMLPILRGAVPHSAYQSLESLKFQVTNNRLSFIYSFIHVLLEAVTSVVPGEDPSMVYTAMGQYAQHRQTNLDYSHERHF